MTLKLANKAWKIKKRKRVNNVKNTLLYSYTFS